jgi:hypothetical protein
LALPTALNPPSSWSRHWAFEFGGRVRLHRVRFNQLHTVRPLNRAIKQFTKRQPVHDRRCHGGEFGRLEWKRLDCTPNAEKPRFERLIFTKKRRRWALER